MLEDETYEIVPRCSNAGGRKEQESPTSSPGRMLYFKRPPLGRYCPPGVLIFFKIMRRKASTSYLRRRDASGRSRGATRVVPRNNKKEPPVGRLELSLLPLKQTYLGPRRDPELRNFSKSDRRGTRFYEGYARYAGRRSEGAARVVPRQHYTENNREKFFDDTSPQKKRKLVKERTRYDHKNS